MKKITSHLMLACFLAATAAPVLAQTLDTHFICSDIRKEDGDGERVNYADQGRFSLDKDKIKTFQWESSLFRTTHGFDCSIDESDGVQAEVTEKGWRVTLKDALAARAARGYDTERGNNCSIRLERDGDEVHIKPTCAVMCGSRNNFTALTVNAKTGACHYDE
ncbi:hypothetical protein ACO0LO_23325 [Undibacterium sp. TJN25]|uniref:hypothetical protein n=1 Tax=Undibacterium sp. TJN25 TaxID=3413056 RepID=UPI003BF05820